MGKPTYFKFFDGYVDTLRSCRTHKDRSILLLAMFEFWDTGVIPVIPEHLRDKWRFLINSLKVSRAKSYEKLDEGSVEKEQKNALDSSGFVSENNEPHIDNQQDKPKHCSVTVQPLLAYRIGNTESKSIESVNTELKNDGMGRIVSIGNDDTIISNDMVSEDQHKNGATSTNTSQNRYSQEVISEVGSKVLSAIIMKYKAHNGQPVCYTRVEAKNDFNIEPDLFYAVMNDLVSMNEVKRDKYKTSDGTTIFSYTLTPMLLDELKKRGIC